MIIKTGYSFDMISLNEHLTNEGRLKIKRIKNIKNKKVLF